MTSTSIQINRPTLWQRIKRQKWLLLMLLPLLVLTLIFSYVPLTGVETRTSAPVRILRGEDCAAVGHPDIYPCGEGAGYAGGIVSAAVDGIRVASKIIEKYSPVE